MADLTGYTLLKNTTKKTRQMNALYMQSGEYWVLLATLIRTKIQSFCQQWKFYKLATWKNGFGKQNFNIIGWSLIFAWSLQTQIKNKN